jgi:hypothetical protein
LFGDGGQGRGQHGQQGQERVGGRHRSGKTICPAIASCQARR